ncbi:cytochrome c oxidase cbb3-type subunit I/II [Dehalogenimonas formicexedens]|uniref:Cytochrome c oxidase cbb3-type subunit I/II n=1 Tax=Dehalogenimonas formicexedens TaxID=1839801 RepID=A0A1P8F7G9_9CHLR|nr:cbb3-type cytochrome c oxidase subunit I [Dehalogenimonas formicexedens]APV44424.1 cytochrome c oxidase cbb3-type subunit I/II [Dehalogenimonas formicexedens]
MSAHAEEVKQVAVPPESEFKETDKVAKIWFIFATLWFPFFTSFGLLLAIKFFFPDFLSESAWDTFGRIRPSHVNGVLFGFLSSGLLGIMFWTVPRMCARGLYKAKVAMFTPFLWNFGILAGIIWIMLGGSQGREYAELPWAIDIAVMACLFLNIYNIWGTILTRREPKLYVSLWYYMGTTLWFPIVYFVGNVMWHPATGALNGTLDGIFNWYYGHNVLGLWFTTLGIPAWYYFIPRLLNRPLYSHLLSIISFFSIALIYTGVGGHHLLQSPIPEWLKTVSVVMTVLMMVPVLAFMTNIGLTMRGSWHKLTQSTVLQFIFAGFVMYVLTSIQGTLQGLRSTNAYLHFNQWTISHDHLALLGGFGFLCVGGIFWLLPQIWGKQLWGGKLSMRTTWWVAFLGFLTFFSSMVVSGLIASGDWWMHLNVVETLPALRISFIWRAIGGGIIILGAYIFAITIFMTWWKSRVPFKAEIPELIEGVSAKSHSKWMNTSQEKINVPIITIGGLTGFLLMSFTFLVMSYMYAADAPSMRAQPLTEAQQAGLLVYKANGCEYCHNQFIRPQDWAMGYTSQAGDFYFSVPNFLGTERTGPSLGQIGGKRPTVWDIQHEINPRSRSPRSIMPSFAWMSDTDLNNLAAYLQSLGGEDLDPSGFYAPVPYEFSLISNPHVPLMMQVASYYDPETQTYTGPESLGKQWADIFEQGKTLFAQKCLPCHGDSGNGMGPYARQTLAHPANLHERIALFADAGGDAMHFWRIHEGVPGTAMPPWGWTVSDDDIFKIMTYEMSFVIGPGAVRTVSGDVSDQEGDDFDAQHHPKPLIPGTEQDFNKGKGLYAIYCAQCHGDDGHGDGPASIVTAGTGYIQPEPANFEESGGDFTNYGRWVWKVTEGVETTNMPPWKEDLTDIEIAQVILYEQSFSKPDDYNSKWAPLYTDPFAVNLMKGG